MAFDPFDDDKSETQRKILQVYDRNPDMAPKHIADKVGCSASYVRQTINEFRGSGGLLDF